MDNEILDQCEKEMKKKLESLDKDLARLRTGRASPQLLDGIFVDYYGVSTPVHQAASVTVPDARTILVSPYEKTMLSKLEKAILIADVGVQPNNDGNVLRLPIPPLNEERRKEISKSAKKIGEDTKIKIRKVRQDHNNQLRKKEKDKEINQDESKELQKKIQDSTNKFSQLVDETIQKKTKDIMSF